MEVTERRAPRVRVFEALRHRDFRLLFLGQTVSLIGDAAFVTALGWRTFALAASGRLRRRAVLCYAVFVVNSLTIVAFALSPWYELAGALAVIRGICIGFGVAVWETMLMQLVPDHLLSRVVSLDYLKRRGNQRLPRACSSGCPDLNWGPLRPERSALPGCATPRAVTG